MPIYYVGSYRNLSHFEASTESWSQYMERLEQLFVTNKITCENWQHAIFLTSIILIQFLSNKTQHLYTTLEFAFSCDLSVEDAKRTDKQILYSHYDPITPEIVVYYKFYSRI